MKKGPKSKAGSNWLPLLGPFFYPDQYVLSLPDEFGSEHDPCTAGLANARSRVV